MILHACFQNNGLAMTMIKNQKKIYFPFVSTIRIPTPPLGITLIMAINLNYKMGLRSPKKSIIGFTKKCFMIKVGQNMLIQNLPH